MNMSLAMKSGVISVFAVLLTASAAMLAQAVDETAAGRGNGPIIYVTSQALYFDSIVVADPVPGKGRFQELRMGLNGLETDDGPGDKGYVGGRWMEDFDGDGNFHYFVCPLLGPGRPNP